MAMIAVRRRGQEEPLKIIDTEKSEFPLSENEHEKIRQSLLFGTLEKLDELRWKILH